MPTSRKRRRKKSVLLGRCLQADAAFLHENFERIGLSIPLSAVERQNEPTRIGVPGAISWDTGQIHEDDEMKGSGLQPLFPNWIGGALSLSGGAALAEGEHG